MIKVWFEKEHGWGLEYDENHPPKKNPLEHGYEFVGYANSYDEADEMIDDYIDSYNH